MNSSKLLKLAIVLMITLSNINTYAQVDYSETELSKIDLIQKSRNLLIDKVLMFDKEGVEYYRNQLLDKEDENYASLLLVEKLLLNYWLNEYQEVKVEIKTYKLKSLEKDTKIYPKSRILLQKLIEKTKVHKNLFVESIKNSEQANQDKDFLILNLDFLISGDEQSEINQDDINKSSNIFLKNYPDSDYEEFIRRYVKYEFKPSDWGYGVEFFTGYGFFTKEMSKIFSNNVPFGLTFDVAYKKTTFYLRGYVGFGKTKEDLTIPNSNEIWSKGTHVNTVDGEIAVGYDVYENDKIKLTPLIGISGIGIIPVENDIKKQASLEDAGTNFAGALNVGINFDWKFKKDNAGLFMLQPSESYWYIRTRYSYHMANFKNDGVHLNGDFHYITIGIGGFGRKMKRVK